ncbi:MAG: alkaline phosphatase family protein [Thiotrichales bacterium]
MAEVLPDYEGGGIVNLMQSLISGCGGVPRYPLAAGLSAAEVAAARHVAFWVIDGLGYDWLSAHLGQGCLASHRRAPLTSVYPSTTAAAITSFLTGAPPRRHGLVGWFTYLRELDNVFAVLPGRLRGGEVLESYDPRRFTGLAPVFDQLAVPSYVIAPEHIAHSRFNQAYLGRAKLVTFRTLPELFARATQVLRTARERVFLYLYWPELDSIGHEFGMESREAWSHLRTLDTEFARWLEQISGSDTLVVVTADHGQVDTRAADHLALDDHPELAACLVQPFGGEPRAVYCHVHPERRERFLQYVDGQLGTYLDCRPASELVAAGWYGAGPSHPEISQRIGDYVLVMKDRYVLKDWLPGELRYRQVGVHGGTRAEEMWVPLIAVRT